MSKQTFNLQNAKHVAFSDMLKDKTITNRHTVWLTQTNPVKLKDYENFINYSNN